MNYERSQSSLSPSELLTYAQELAAEAVARKAVEDPYFWLTECTKTKDEQDTTGDPFKPFPKRPYIEPLLDALENEPVLFLEKSRTMMASWTVSAWAAHRMFTRPATGVVFQSEDEDRAVHCVNYTKILWDQSLAELKARWPTYRGKDPWIQPYNNFKMENGSWCLGIVGNPDKIRSQHPTIVVLDEACYITRGEESFNVAQATRCHHIVCLSSANPSWFRERTEFASPSNWPEYKSSLAA